jgi:hypothetical protein
VLGCCNGKDVEKFLLSAKFQDDRGHFYSVRPCPENGCDLVLFHRVSFEFSIILKYTKKSCDFEAVPVMINTPNLQKKERKQMRGGAKAGSLILCAANPYEYFFISGD